MKILIAADMEGITGVVCWDHVTSTHPEYGRFRRLMTGDVNAAIRGAFDGGADEVMVTDGHGSARNILIEELDPRARLNAGGPRPLSMVEGVDEGVNGVLFVGYHARIGSQEAVLEHTWSDRRVAGLAFNGTVMGEIGMNAAVCGHFGVPVVMIAGDQTACAEAATLLGDLETAVVKQAQGRMAARCLPPEATAALIHDAAVRAVTRVCTGQAPQPYRLAAPVTVTVDLVQTEMADAAAILPGARRTGPRRVEATADDMPTAYRFFRTIVALAG